MTKSNLPAVNSQGEAWCPICGATETRQGTIAHGASCEKSPDYKRLVARFGGA